MSALCECGCGQHPQIAAKSDRRTGARRGQPLRYCHGHNHRRAETPPAPRPQPASSPSLDDYVMQLRYASERIVGAVRDEGVEAVALAVDQALILEAPPGVDPAVALAVVLAGQVDPDAPAEQRLGWTRALEAAGAA